MAGDYIPMRIDLEEDPAVITICTFTGLDEFAVVGRLKRIWGWFNQQSADGFVQGITAAWIDRLVRHEGFAAAMENVGWLVIEATGCRIPKYDNWMSKSAKRRLEDMQRKRAKKFAESVRKVCGTPAESLRNACGQNRVTGEERREEESTGEERKEIPPDPPEQPAVVQEPDTEPEQPNAKPVERSDSPQPSQSWGSFLATEWAFYHASPAPSQRDVSALTRFFADLSAQVPPDRILARIRDPARPKREPTWDFEKFFRAAKNGKPAKESMSDAMKRMRREQAEKGEP